MMSILHPFAEHVRELQSQMHELSDSMSKTCSDVDQHKTKLHHHEVQIVALFDKAKESTEKTNTMSKDLAETRRDLRETQSSHATVKVSLSKAEDVLQTTVSTVAGLKQEAADVGAKVSRLLTDSAELTRRLDENVERKMESMHNFCKELNDQQFDLQKNFKEANSSAAATAQRLHSLTQACNQKHKEDEANFANWLDCADGLKMAVAGANKELQLQNDTLAAKSEELACLKKQANQLVSPEHLQTHLNALRVTMDGLDQRAQQSEDSIAEIIFDSTSDKR